MQSYSHVVSNGHSPALFNRELSWIAFNRRLLYEVANQDLPLLTRTLRLAQTAAALDEYFMVRIPLLTNRDERRARTRGGKPSLPLIRPYLKLLIARQQTHFWFNLRRQLSRQNIHLLDYAELSDLQRARCYRRFEDEIAPVITALTTLPDDPLPDFSNLSLNLAVSLGQDTTTQQLGWIKVPRVLPRFIVFPGMHRDNEWTAVPLEHVIAAHTPKLFPAYQFQGCFPFRVTRSADLGALDSETANLMDMIQESLQQRHQQGQAVRLETLHSMPDWVRSRLIHHLQIEPEDAYRLGGWLGLSDLRELAQLPRPELLETALNTKVPKALSPKPAPSRSLSVVQSPSSDIFDVLRTRDLLLHFPYHSFVATVERFVAQAAQDPAVLAIKITLYRTAVNSPIVRSLMAAAKAGKQIVVLVELTAPLDEAINIHWARSLEKSGAHVVYGLVGFRTHTNLVLVTRREERQLLQYAYIGTGDYIADRPQAYEDIGLLTSRSSIGSDLSRLFNFLTGCSRQVTYSTLIVAPGQLKSQLQQLIEREIDHAKRGKPAQLVIKLNLLADRDIIETLYTASQAGVEIDLIVRGICRLRPGVAGLSDRIRVTSVLGRFVEHSRIFYCRNDGDPEAWIGTADWTPRGLSERIEVMVPLPSPELVADIKHRLDCWLADNENAWILQADGRYLKRQRSPDEASVTASAEFMRLSS